MVTKDFFQILVYSASSIALEAPHFPDVSSVFVDHTFESKESLNSNWPLILDYFSVSYVSPKQKDSKGCGIANKFFQDKSSLM